MAAGKGQTVGADRPGGVGLIAAGIVGFRVAVGVLKGKVVEALGPDSEISDIRVGRPSVSLCSRRSSAATTLRWISSVSCLMPWLSSWVIWVSFVFCSRRSMCDRACGWRPRPLVRLPTGDGGVNGNAESAESFVGSRLGRTVRE